MQERYRPFKQCIYPSVCDDCDGLPPGVAVHLRSGQRVDFSDVAGIELTRDEIILHTEGGEQVRFPRTDVVYAGCSRSLPPPME
jgi:hypothetical protein